jgi:hypothetical protein
LIQLNKITVQAEERLSFEDKSHVKHGLHGHVRVLRKNKKTGEVCLWDEKDNIIPISGYQWILMKMFGLYLDSPHDVSYEDIGRDTSVIIPDLNEDSQLKIGIAPENYSTMNENIASSHFVQGFMIGNGGSGEDAITAKNTDYAFTCLRNPIPFQQTATTLSPDIAGKYLGKLRYSQQSYANSFYIKKFEETPHIMHSWWREGQRWNYTDPVVQSDLGPMPTFGTTFASNHGRIESYCECELALDDNDCAVYFAHEGNTQSAVVNELGLVAYDAVAGTKTTVELLYQYKIKQFIQIAFDNNRLPAASAEAIALAAEITTVATELHLADYGQTNIAAMVALIGSVATATPETIDFTLIKTELSSATDIGVEAFYNQNGMLMYTTDNFLTYMNDPVFYQSTPTLDALTTDEAQRIKLITYYTFNAIPLDNEWQIIFQYRIYAN